MYFLAVVVTIYLNFYELEWIWIKSCLSQPEIPISI